jgi:hypothetical protein
MREGQTKRGWGKQHSRERTRISLLPNILSNAFLKDVMAFPILSEKRAVPSSLYPFTPSNRASPRVPSFLLSRAGKVFFLFLTLALYHTTPTASHDAVHKANPMRVLLSHARRREGWGGQRRMCTDAVTHRSRRVRARKVSPPRRFLRSREALPPV